MPPSEKRTQNSAPAKTQQNRAQPQQQRRTQPVSERTMPHNLEAERSVLGAILVNPEAYEEIADRLDATDFFRDAHRRIFLTLEKVLDDGVVIDLVTVKDQLMKTGELDEVGGPAYLASLSDGMPRSANIVHYAEIVREKARLRDAIHTANKLLAASYLAENPSREIVAEAAESLLDLSGAATGGKPILLGDMMASCMASLASRQGSRSWTK
jgi:replicative DNA helicase